jgi:hypothetical protein
MGTSGRSGVTWVIVDGVPRHVSDFASTPVRRRPECFCHHCGERLTMKLGHVLEHHAAHRPGADCPTTHPETALHSDCKLALAAALRDFASPDAVMSYRLRCVGAGDEPCSRTTVIQWTGGWDSVHIERRLNDASRPDILLWRDGSPVGAVEIVVSHALAAAKSESLATLGVPWVEIDADPTRRTGQAWNFAEPIDARRVNDIVPWRCAVHAGIAAMSRAVRVVRESSPADCARATELRYARVVDLYRSSGGHERFIYKVVEERLTTGHAGTLRLLRGTLEVATLPRSEDAPERDDDRAGALALAFRADIDRLRRDDDTFADSPMRWAGEAAAEFIVQEAMFDQRRPDPTVLATTYPRRWFFSPASRRWFLPDDMRDVRWDRAAHDPFAAHPAWRPPHASTRAAPEGSWSTFIFARRPTPASFVGAVDPTEVAPGIVRLVVDVETPRRPARRSRRGARRLLFVVTREIDDVAIADAMLSAQASDAADGEMIWLSHPREWRPALRAVPWLAAGCDSRGRAAVLIDGIGVFRAEAFVSALRRGDVRLNSDNIVGAMRERVERLAAQATIRSAR